MRVFVLLALVAVACAAKERVKGVYEKADYEAFKAQHGKVYRDRAEELKRYEIYLNNIAEINAHNMLYDQGKSTYWMGPNYAIDWTQEELDARNGFIPKTPEGPFHVASGDKLATSVDWREKGAVNDVKDQGHCGSCWAFGTLASLESRVQIATGTLPNCSEQQLVSCDTHDNGCGGGHLDTVYKYIHENGDNGVDTQTSYPYVSGDGSEPACDSAKVSDGQDIAATCTGSTSVLGEDNLKDAVATQGVVAIAVYANSAFQKYAGGVFDDILCLPILLNHAVSAVGYNEEGNYWIVRNSWSSSWGEEGYIRMVMGKNMCGLANMAVYPNL